MESKGTVLVSGANGYIAGRTVEALLKAGYRVRGTVRSLKSAEALQAVLSSYSKQLEIVEVPDITATGAFDEAVKGVTAIAHLASPVSFFYTDPEPVIRGAVAGTLSILESAAKQASVKSFVLLSSITAIMRNLDVPHTYTEADWNDFAEAVVAKRGKDTPGPVIYSASKTAGEKAFWKFAEDRKPSFSMTAINPSFVIGPPMIAPATPEQVSETIKIIWDVLKGEDLASAGIRPGNSGFVDVRDVARLVVFGVDHPDVTNGQRFLTVAGYGGAQAAADVLRKAYPERRDIIQEGRPGEGYAPDYAFPKEEAAVYDGSKVIRTTGERYIPFDQSVLDTANSFQGLL